MRVFLSHTRIDKSFVEQLANSLKSHDIEVWFDKWEIKVGNSIVDKINQALKATDHLVIVLSRASVESIWVKEELNAALMRRLSNLNIGLLPVLLETCDIPPLIAHLRYADFTGDFGTGLRELLDSLLPDQYFLDKLSVSQTEFAILKQILLALKNKLNEDVTLDEASMNRLTECEYHLCRLYDLMDQAASVRYQLEYKNDPDNVMFETMRCVPNLFKRLEIIEQKQGFSLRSEVWHKLVGYRNSRMHKMDLSNSHLQLLNYFGEQRLNELEKVLVLLCGANEKKSNKAN